MPTLTFKVSQQEARAICRAALARQKTLGRRKIKAARSACRERDVMKPGCVIIDTPPISRESIDAALSNYLYLKLLNFQTNKIIHCL